MVSYLRLFLFCIFLNENKRNGYNFWIKSKTKKMLIDNDDTLGIFENSFFNDKDIIIVYI